MKSTKQIADTLGRAEIAAACGVERAAVTNYLRGDKKFPGHWWGPMLELARRDGIEIEMRFFNMAHPKPSHSAPIETARVETAPGGQA